MSESIAGIQDVFHVSQLWKCTISDNKILDPNQVELERDVSYEKQRIEILDQKIKDLRNKKIQLVKVLRHNHHIGNATWEKEEEIRQLYPEIIG